MSNAYFWLNKAKSRFYTITVINRNSDEVTLHHKWGSCNSNRGGAKEIALNSAEELQISIVKMLKRRKSRGYELISPLSL